MQEMGSLMEIVLTGLAVAGIIALVASVIYLRERIVFLRERVTASKDERRNMERRVGVLEEDVSLLKKVLVTLENLKVNISHILDNQKRDSEKLQALNDWQKEHQGTIDDAKHFIHETTRDGVRTKE